MSSPTQLSLSSVITKVLPPARTASSLASTMVPLSATRATPPRGSMRSSGEAVTLSRPADVAWVGSVSRRVSGVASAYAAACGTVMRSSVGEITLKSRPGCTTASQPAGCAGAPAAEATEAKPARSSASSGARLAFHSSGGGRLTTSECSAEEIAPAESASRTPATVRSVPPVKAGWSPSASACAMTRSAPTASWNSSEYAERSVAGSSVSRTVSLAPGW